MTNTLFILLILYGWSFFFGLFLSVFFSLWSNHKKRLDFGRIWIICRSCLVDHICYSKCISIFLIFEIIGQKIFHWRAKTPIWSRLTIPAIWFIYITSLADHYANLSCHLHIIGFFFQISQDKSSKSRIKKNMLSDGIIPHLLARLVLFTYF